MKTMDRRIAERRHRVTEERARTRLRLVIGLVALVALAAAGFALVRSPLLSVNRVTVTGHEHSDPAAVLARLDVVPGMPTVSVDAGAIEAALRADPWVADARVVVSWPGSVDVEVTEQVPVAAVTTAGGSRMSPQLVWLSRCSIARSEWPSFPSMCPKPCAPAQPSRRRPHWGPSSSSTGCRATSHG